MNLSKIETESEYENILDWIADQFDKKVDRNTPEGKKLEVALALIKNYEDEHFPIPSPKT